VKRRKPINVGLRARSSIAFGLLALVLSSVLAGFTYNRSRVYLLKQREGVAVALAGFNARLLANALRASPDDGAGLLSSVINGSGSQPMLFRDNSVYVTSANVSPDDLPSELRRAAFAGIATRQRFMLRGQPQLAVAVPITIGARTPTVFVATTPLTELQRTLTTLATTLAAGAAGATIIGAVLGLYASRRVLRPLSRIADTAERIAAGDLDARLSGLDDPDLTRLVATFNAMTDSLEERIQRERRFASHVSHELRSPLTSLRGAMDLVRGRGVELPERAQIGVDLLDQQVGRFERMVLDLLEMATIEAGAATVDLTSLSVAPLVTATMLHVGASTVPIDVTADARAARVNVDARRFERVIDNLIGNADRHAGGATCVRVSRDGVMRRVRIHVDDAGPGVAPNERSRIFDRFARGAQGRHLAGAGLGLALVQEHVRLMRGTVHVTESPDGGARFTVDLPEADAS
jgi:two-component system, OmpR family, sensor histidine kinase MtrB